MIVPSIDIVAGSCVQLVGGEEQALDAGDPVAILNRFAVVGEVAVVDIDAARGEGENSRLVETLVESAPIRVGGGIRSVGSALHWLDRGAEKVIIGTAAGEDLFGQLPQDRVIAALDARHGEVVTHGWRRAAGAELLESVRRFRGLVGGFLVTFVEREGRMGGTDLELARRVVEEAGEARVTIAGGIATAGEIAELDAIGADAQVGMALYTGRLDLAEAFSAPLRSDRADGLWPTVVVDEHGVALGLAWSNLSTLTEAIETRRGIYRSRTRGQWVKGQTSGATQHLLGVDVDCDRDVIRFTVNQTDGFCHEGTRTCWGSDHGITRLARRISGLGEQAPEGSNTARVLSDPRLLGSKLVEEANELAAARESSEVAEEAADLLYFALARCAAAGVELHEVAEVLDRRERRVTRRPMRAKEEH